MRIEWRGIPEGYWPDTEKPWRCSWGFGAHKDFATEEEAREFWIDMLHEDALKAHQKMFKWDGTPRMTGWGEKERPMEFKDTGLGYLINDPYDVLALTKENRNEPGVSRHFTLQQRQNGEWILAEV